MKLLFKQRLFSWFDSYDIYDEAGGTLFTVKGQLAWGHRLQIYDAGGRPVGMVKEVVLSFLPRFELYAGDTYLGCIKKDFTFFKPSFTVDFCGWSVQGDFLEWDYTVYSAEGQTAAVVSKEIFNWADTYTIEVANPGNALYALMLVLAIDAEKCSRS